MLEVRLFGKFEIKYDGQSVMLSSRIAQSLFAYLILTAGTSHRREKLAGMFWPDASEAKARAYLRHELWRIRKALSSRARIEYLITDDIHISFNTVAEYRLDVESLTRLNDISSIDELIKALSHCQGELLPGFYDGWIMQEREHLQVLYEQKTGQLLELLSSEKRWQETVDWAERWIAHSHGPEAAYRFMMIAYDAMGDRAKVTSTYQRCVQALRELELEPSEQTRSVAFKRTPRLNMPIPLTSFIGRENELKEISGLLEKSRLVTLTGSGGVGKTRLAIQVVADVLDRFPDGVWFLDLAPLNDPSLVPNTLIDVLGLHESENSKLSVIERLLNYLQSRIVLIIFDNCEHLVESSAQLVNLLLTSCENLSVLATSREALRVAGEIPYRVPSLALPTPEIESAVDDLLKNESVRLFIERTTFAAPQLVLDAQNVFTVAQICQRLDGIPLAIELAAARSNVLTVEQILKRLDNRFNLLTGGLRTALPRHQTLRATIEWSYDLLSEQEQILFRRLAVFVGGWTLEAAEEVCSGHGVEFRNALDVLAQLVNKSLIIIENPNGGIRYRVLETIRQFAREKLEVAGEIENIQQQHLAYFVELAERAEPHLRAFDMVRWLNHLEVELDNIRVALAHAEQSDVEAQLRMASALLWFWHIRDHKIEGVDWLKRGLSIEATQRCDYPPTSNRAMIRGKALNAAGFVSLLLSETNKGALLAQESLKLFRELGVAGKQGTAYALLDLAAVADHQLDLPRRKVLLEESLALFQEVDDKIGIAHCISGLGFCALDEEDYHQARMLLEEHLALCQEIGDKDGKAFALLGLGSLASKQRNYKQATIHYEESLSGFREVGNRWAMGLVLSFLGQTAQAHGDFEKATTMLEGALDFLNQNLGDKFSIASRLNELGSVARSQGDYKRAKQLHERAFTLFREMDNKLAMAYALRHEGLTAFAEDDYGQAVEKFEQSLSISKGVGDTFQMAFALYGLGRVAQAQAEFTLARKLNIEAITIFQETTNPADLIWGGAHCLDSFATLAIAQHRWEQSARLFSAAENLYNPLRFEMSAKERAEHDQAVSIARAALGEEAFASAWKDGQTMKLEEAVAYALKEFP
jgi:predicted ATPase/DNA-binding SARP family transcriptional activator